MHCRGMCRNYQPDECLYVLETLGTVYGADAAAREQKLSWEARLLLHQEKSGP